MSCIDTFELYKGTTKIPIRTDGIAWSVDKNNKFKRNSNWLTTQYLDVEDGNDYYKLLLIV